MAETAAATAAETAAATAAVDDIEQVVTENVSPESEEELEGEGPVAAASDGLAACLTGVE